MKLWTLRKKILTEMSSQWLTRLIFVCVCFNIAHDKDRSYRHHLGGGDTGSALGGGWGEGGL